MDRHDGKTPHRALLSRHRDLQPDESEDQGSHRSHGGRPHAVPRDRVLDRNRAAIQRLRAASCRLARRNRCLVPYPVHGSGGCELSGKVALVTGGARNIGRAISRSLAAGGATVMVNANTSQGDAKNTVAMIKSNGGTAAFHFADVTDPAAVAKMVDATVKQFGRLDILVNNAAVRSETPFEDIKLEEWRHVISTVL